jgi:diguanylate cyclase (GGDEF)-like protein
MGIVAVMTVALAALSAERKSTEERALNLSITDPLTGLANYRRLTDTLDLEIKRSHRSGRPFAILLFDLDQLKQINDTHGHLAGSRALCRLADILRVYCRSIDMAARYGGDEFAVVIPEARKEDARQVAARICNRIAEDSERPALSVSVGLSFFPDDGDTMDALFAAADRALYHMKRQPWRESAHIRSHDADTNR